VAPLPDLTLQPGQYLLMQQAAGSSTGASLPSPETSGNLALAVTATTPDSRGEVRLSWDADLTPLVLSPTGLANANLTTGNASGFRFAFASTTVASEIEITVYDSATDFSRAGRRVPVSGAPFQVLIPFAEFRVPGGSGADFARRVPAEPAALVPRIHRMQFRQKLRHAQRHANWPQGPQYEFLADSLWTQFAYGRNAVYPRGLHQDVGLELQSTLGRGGIGRHKRTAGAGGEDHDAALLQVPSRAPPNVRLGHAVHANRREESRFDSQRFDGVLQGQAIDHRGQHAHVVGRGLLNADVGVLELRSAENVAAANHQADLAAAIGRLLDLAGDVHRFFHANAALAAMAEALAGQFQDDSFIHG